MARNPSARVGRERKPATGRTTMLGLWCSHLGLSPFYMHPSGQPQYADYALVVLLAIMMLTRRIKLPRAITPAARTVSLLAAWVATVSVCWWVSTGDLMFLVPVGFYTYSLMAFLAPACLYQMYRTDFIRWTLLTVAGSIVVQIVMGMISPERVSRFGSELGFLYFNNTNQCAYYALLAGGICLACCSLYDAGRLRLIQHAQPLLYGGLAMLCMFTESRSGSLCSLALALIAMRGRRLTQTLGYAAVAGTVALLIVVTGLGDKASERVLQRAGNLQQSLVDELYHRGYDRIANHPEYWLAGAGERFMNDDPRIESEFYGELHSTLGGVFFSYGGVGLALMLVALFQLQRAAGLSALLPLAPALVFGLTTNGIRHSEFWSLMAIVGCSRVQAMHVSARVRSAVASRPRIRARPRLA